MFLLVMFLLVTLLLFAIGITAYMIAIMINMGKSKVKWFYVIPLIFSVSLIVIIVQCFILYV